MDHPKNLAYAAAFTLISTYGAGFTPLDIPLVREMYQQAQVRAQYMVNTGDVSEMAELSSLATTLQGIQKGDLAALLTLAQEQEASALPPGPTPPVDESTTYLLVY